MTYMLEGYTYDYSVGERYSPIAGRTLRQLTLAVPGGGCKYWLKTRGQGCTFCGFPGLTRRLNLGDGRDDYFGGWRLDARIFEGMYRSAIENAEAADKLALFNGGSFFVDGELPPEFRHRFIADASRRPGLVQIMVESRPEYVTPAALDEAAPILGAGRDFADGAFGIGQPVRGNGFAIVEAHQSIAGKTVTVGAGEDVRARSDWLGSAVVSDVPAYTNSTLAVDVADLPVGYSLGAGGFDTHAPHKAGYRLRVGSDYSVSAYGTLLKANGEPVGLLTGTASPVDDPARQVAIFTNAAGRFGAEGLAPGRWTITMATEDTPTVFELTVPEGTDGLFRAGELRPARKG